VLEPGIKPQEVLFLGTELIQTVKIVFEPNPYFREKDKPYFSKIILNGGGTGNEAARRVLEQGDVDYSYNLQLEPQVLDQMAGSGVGEVVANFGARVEQIFLNHTDPNTEVDGVVSSVGTSHPFFKDIRVRQAFAFAIDHAAIANIYGSTGVATSNNLVVPASYVSPNKYFEFNPNKAKSLLEEAGWVDSDGDGIREKDGVKLKVITRAVLNTLQDKSQRIIRNNLEEIGVGVQIDLEDTGVYLLSDPNVTPENIFRFTADLQSIDISSESPDPGTYMNYWICSQIPQKTNGWSGINLSRWCNPAYDELFRQSTVEIDPEKRKELFIQMNDLLVQDVAMIPLVHLAKVSGIKADIEGIRPTPWDAELWNVKDWSRAEP
jgi:peptide/nickel transport system substrate-binding protein